MRLRHGSPGRRPARSAVLAFVTLVPTLVLAAAGPAAAQSVAAGVHGGTSGIGPDLTFRLNDHAHVRITGGGGVSYDTEVDTTAVSPFLTQDLTYDVEGDLETAFLLLDWYPLGGGFRISAGGGWNGVEASVSTPAYELIDHLYPNNPVPLPALDYGDLVGTAKGDDFVPAVLVGWGNPFRGGAWNVSFEVGAFYQGEPEVELRFVPSDRFFEDGRVSLALAEAVIAASGQEEQLEEELSDYELVPIVSLGVSYRF